MRSPRFVFFCLLLFSVHPFLFCLIFLYRAGLAVKPFGWDVNQDFSATFSSHIINIRLIWFFSISFFVFIAFVPIWLEFKKFVLNCLMTARGPRAFLLSFLAKYIDTIYSSLINWFSFDCFPVFFKFNLKRTLSDNNNNLLFRTVMDSKNVMGNMRNEISQLNAMPVKPRNV